MEPRRNLNQIIVTVTNLLWICHNYCHDDNNIVTVAKRFLSSVPKDVQLHNLCA